MFRRINTVRGRNYKLLSVFVIAGSFLAAVSCVYERPPEGVLTRDQMVAMLEEIYIAEEKTNRLALKRDSAEQVFSYFKTRIFEDAGTTDSVFRRSFNYYMDRPRQMELIYTALVDSLQLREQRTPYRPDQQ